MFNSCHNDSDFMEYVNSNLDGELFLYPSFSYAHNMYGCINIKVAPIMYVHAVWYYYSPIAAIYAYVCLNL